MLENNIVGKARNNLLGFVAFKFINYKNYFGGK